MPIKPLFTVIDENTVAAGGITHMPFRKMSAEQLATCLNRWVARVARIDNELKNQELTAGLQHAELENAARRTVHTLSEDSCPACASELGAVCDDGCPVQALRKALYD